MNAPPPLPSAAALLLTLAAAAAAGLIAARFRIPGGLMIGAIIGAALLNIFSGAAYMPKQTKLLVQIIAGSFIGCGMEKSDLQKLPTLIKPVCIMLGSFLLLNILAGFLIHALSPLDLVTALLSAVPGGISDTPLIAQDMGADAPKVAVMQTARLIFGLGVFPSLIARYDKRGKAPAPPHAAPIPPAKAPAKPTPRPAAFIATLLAGTAAGILGKLTAVPAMAFVLPIATALVLKLAFDFACIPPVIRKTAQVLSGAYLGSGIFMKDVRELRYLLAPLAIIITGYVLNCLFTGTLLKKTCGFSQKEAMLITIPAGASDMALISADLGITNPNIALLQVIRLIAVMSIFPQIINLIVYIVQGSR